MTPARVTAARARLSPAGLAYAYLAAVLLVAAVYPFLSTLGDSIAYDLVSVSVVGAILAGIRLWHPPRRPWLLFAAGQAFFAAGDLTSDVYQSVLHEQIPFPSLADAFYLAAYPLFALGLVALLHGAGRRRRDGLVDSALVAVATGMAVWAGIVVPAEDPTSSALAQVTSTAYPICDVILLGVLAHVLFTRVARTRSYVFLVVSVVLLFAADMLYAHLSISGTYSGGLVDMLWLVSYAFWGAAALHPSVRRVLAVESGSVGSLTLARASALVAALVAAELSLLLSDTEEGLDLVLLGTGGALVAVLVFFRLARLVRGNEHLRLAAERAAAELGQREALFRALTEHGYDVVVVVDVHGRVRYRTPSAERAFGYVPGELEGVNLLDLVHPDDLPATGGLFDGLARTPGESATLDLRVRTKTGAWAEVEGVVTNLLQEPSVRGFTLNIRNVTERRRAERTLSAKDEQLRHAQKLEAVGRLAGGIAHDFNNLLTAITGYAQLVVEGSDTGPQARADATEIASAADRAGSLTRQLLAFSRRQVLQPTHVDLNEVVVQMIRLLERLIGEDVQLFTKLAPDLGTVRADRGQLEQVLLNLVVNARDAMPDGGIVTIETSNVSRSDGEFVSLVVVDTGSGMDSTTREHIFEPFFTTKPAGRGTGLGLATVYGIVAQSGGEVVAESEAGAGALFRVLLPRVAAVQAVPDDLPGEPVDGGRETVLVVEDEEAVRSLVRRSLERQGYRVLDRAEPPAAIELCRDYEGAIDLLVTDVVMPKMTGWALADRLLELRPGLRVLYTSGYAEAEDGESRANGDLGAFLGKPFTPDVLASKVREVLDAVG